MRFIDAYFTNNERTVVSILWENDKKEVVEETVLAEANEPGWENLLNQPEVTIDKSHERTVNRNREQRAIFEEQVVEIAKRDGIIYDQSVVNTGLYKLCIKTIFGTHGNTENNKKISKKEVSEKLFMFKLALFEIDKIKESTDREAKAALRKAETIPSALKIAIDIFES